MNEEDRCMLYSVMMHVEGRYIVEVEAGSLDEAIQKASEAVYEDDFGKLEKIESEFISADY